jgi:hypothetical protein
LDLFLDYAHDVKLYPAFQEYFRKSQPPLLAVRGKHDPFLIPAGAEAFQRDNQNATVQLLDADTSPWNHTSRRWLSRCGSFSRKLLARPCRLGPSSWRRFFKPRAAWTPQGDGSQRPLSQRALNLYDYCTRHTLIKNKQPVGVPGHKCPGLKQLGKIVSSSLLHSPLIVFPPESLANSRFRTMLFGINKLRSGRMLHFCAQSGYSGPFMQALYNQQFHEFLTVRGDL